MSQHEVPSIEAALNIEHTPEKKIEDAKHFFASEFGIQVSLDGFLNTPNETQLRNLEEWHLSTNPGGNHMITEEHFAFKSYLAASLWRQREGDKIKYLFGKGQAVELALQGKVSGRPKNEVKFPYRPHADFDLYDVKRMEPGHPAHSHAFLKVFGPAETYPPDNTKGLEAMPRELMDETAETVNYGGVEFLVPQLELLFLDKFMKGESTPRAEGNDAHLLAQQYKLDKELVLRYAKDYIVKPRIATVTKTYEGRTADAVQRIQTKLIRLQGRGEDTQSLEAAVQELNAYMAAKIEAGSNLTAASGVFLAYWEPIKISQLDNAGNIIDIGLLERITAAVEKEKLEKIQGAENVIKALEEYPF